MRGRCLINGRDAYLVWGVFFSDAAVNALRTPAPMKGYIENKSRLEHGKRVIHDENTARVDDRDLTLVIYIRASNQEQFDIKFDSFVEELQNGRIEIELADRPGVVYRCDYISASQFSQFNGRLGKLTLKLNEPNPQNRDKYDAIEND